MPDDFRHVMESIVYASRQPQSTAMQESSAVDTFTTFVCFKSLRYPIQGTERNLYQVEYY